MIKIKLFKDKPAPVPATPPATPKVEAAPTIPKMEAEAVPGVPGTSEKHESGGHYSPPGEYAECPSCKHVWKIQADNFLARMSEETEGDEPKAEDEKPAESKASDEPTPKHEAAPVVKRDLRLDKEGWQKAIGTHIPRQQNAFQAACAEFAASALVKKA